MDSSEAENLNPRVKLSRDPFVEAAMSKLKKRALFSNPSPTPQKQLPMTTTACFICGDTNIASSRLARRRYQQQVAVYKDFIFTSSFRSSLPPQLCSELVANQESQSCASCLSAIKEVWDLKQQIVSLEQEIEELAEQARKNIRQRSATVEVEVEVDTDAVKIETEGMLDFDFDSSAWDAVDHFGIESSDMEFDEATDNGRISVSRGSVENTRSRRSPKARVTKTKADKLLQETIIHPDKEENLENSDDHNNQSEDDSNFSEDAKNPIKTPKNPNTDLKCKECDKTFASTRTLKTHMQLIHSSDKTSYICDHCGKKFSHARYLKYHVREQHEKDKAAAKIFACKKCGTSFTRRYFLVMHEATVCKLPLDQKDIDHYKIVFYDCEEPDCGFRATTRPEIDAHIRKHTGETPFTCEKCGTNFRSRNGYKTHIKATCAKGTETDQEFKQKYLEGRRFINAKKRQTSWKCSKCLRPFIHEKSLQKHTESCTADQSQPPAMCHLCGKDFASNYQLLRHIKRVHDKEKRVFCSYCNKGFFDNANCAAHVKVHHEKVSNQPTVQCPQCGKLFTTASILKRHQAIVHEGKTRYECDVCSYKCYQRKSLIAHQQTHDKQAFRCEKCGRDFMVEAQFRRHQERYPNCAVVSPKPRWPASNGITCPLCQVVMQNKHSFNNHVKHTHPEQWDWEKRMCKIEVPLSTGPKRKKRKVQEEEEDDSEDEDGEEEEVIIQDLDVQRILQVQMR